MRSRLKMQIGKNLILPAIFILFALSGCSKVTQSPAQTEAHQTVPETSVPATVAVQPTVSEKTTEAVETEERLILPNSFAYQVDLTHDERPELLVVDEYKEDETVGLGVSLTRGSETIWSDNLELLGGAARKAYFLCSVGSDDYLMVYRTYLEENSFKYIAEVFYVTDEGAITPIDNELLYVCTDSFEEYPLDSAAITKFSNWLNWYLSRSTLLCCNVNGEFTYSMTDRQVQYTEEFTELFALVEDYTGCDTITDKVERINEYLYQQWFGEVDPEGTALTVPEDFYEAAERIVEAARPNIWLGEELMADPEIWFLDYDGRKLQIIRSEDEYTTPLSCNDIIFYYASSDESLSDVANYVVERLVAEMTVEAENRSFVITDYRILSQELYDAESCLEECWQSYLWETRTSEMTVQEYLWSWLGYAADEYGFIPVGENMWYFCPNGRFSFDGECGDGKTMEDLSADPSAVVGGKVNFVVEDDPKAVQFVLIKNGSVYRMQRAEAMEELYPELLVRQQETEEAE